MRLVVQLINGDSRRGTYLGHDATHLRIRDAVGVRREIQHIMIKDISEAGQPEACLDAE